MRKVLITDGNSKSALAAIRSLGRNGILVFVGEEFKENLGSASKYCHKRFTYPSPYTNKKGFLKAIQDIIVQENINLIFPMTDITMEIIMSSAANFDPEILGALPAYTSYSMLTNKVELLKLASKLGIMIPESLIIENREELLEAVEKIIFPVVVKPMRSKLFYDGRFWSLSTKYIESKDQLIFLYEHSNYLKYPFIIQKIINGYGAGIFALFDHGKPIIYFSHKRLREKPPSGGVSVFCESKPLAENMRLASEKFLKVANWHGVGMVEFKVDKETNIPYLMEINGRFWGSLQLSIDSGIDFPYLLYCVATNSDFDMPDKYQFDRKSRWLLGDLDHLYFRLFKKKGNEGLPQDFKSKVMALYEFIKYNGKYCNFDVIDIMDICPFIVELKQYIYHSNG